MTTDLTAGCGCGCGGGCGSAACLGMPPEFVRVRYYYGQRLGVMELADQTAYHAGKLAFHNARLHGVGVVCGLRADRFAMVPGSRTTMLRVHRGAALDACGREVVVGIDQCIDIAAWFARMRGRPEVAGWLPGTTQRLRVAIRYRECPSDPTPAPRDACGCDVGGCEYGRVREGFELALHSAASTETCLAQAPGVTALVDALRASGPSLGTSITTLVAGDCPEPGDAEWLCLASVPVILDGAGVPNDIGDPDNAIPERLSLVPTAALQGAMLALAGGGADAGLVGAGPRAGALAFTGSAADAGTLTLPILLGTAGSPPTAVPLEAATFAPAMVKVHRLDVGTGWVDVTPPPADITLAAAPDAIAVKFASGLAAGPRYRLTVSAPVTKPLADQLGRPLTPLPLARAVAFVTSGATLTLDPAL